MKKKIIIISALSIVLYFAVFSAIVLPGIINQVPFTGVKADDDGVLCYYLNSKVCFGTPGLIEYNGSYYEVKWSGKVAVNENRNLTAEKIGDFDIEPGIYYFDEEGKMVLQ